MIEAHPKQSPSIRKPIGQRPYAGREGDPREDGLDYSRVPRDLPYVSVADIDAAYRQGKGEAEATIARLNRTVREMAGQLSELRAELAVPIAALAVPESAQTELAEITGAEALR